MAYSSSVQYLLLSIVLLCQLLFCAQFCWTFTSSRTNIRLNKIKGFRTRLCLKKSSAPLPPGLKYLINYFKNCSKCVRLTSFQQLYQLLSHWFDLARLQTPWPTRMGDGRSTHSAIASGYILCLHHMPERQTKWADGPWFVRSKGWSPILFFIWP